MASDVTTTRWDERANRDQDRHFLEPIEARIHARSDLVEAVLLRLIEALFRLIESFTACFTDHHDPEQIEHPLSIFPALRFARGAI